MAKQVSAKNVSLPPTDKQWAMIESLSKRKGYRFSSQAIKDALGKNPVGGINRERASAVIDFLLSKN